MGVRIGLIAGDAQTAVDVAVLAASAGAQVVPLVPEGDRPGSPAALSEEPVQLVVADIEGASRLVRSSGVRTESASGAGSAAGVQLACGGSGGDGVPVLLVHRPDEREAAQDLAARVGVGHVVELPVGGPWLDEQLRPPTTATRLAVIGATGGAGTTTVAIACAFGADSDCLLVDADPWSAGLDLPLGISDEAGARWASIPDAEAPLVADSVRAALPTVAGVTVLTGPLPDPMGARLGAVLEVGRAAFGRTVVDAGRGGVGLPGSLLDAAVVVCPATLPGVLSTRRLLDTLHPQRSLVAVRPSGWLPVEEVAEQLGGVPVVEVTRLARVGELADCGDLLAGRTGRALRALGQRIWKELA